MSAVHVPSGPHIPPAKKRPSVAPKPPAKPSLRWRLRRWILQKLDAWPREKPEPTTEWGRMRRAERRRLVEEVKALRKEVTDLRDVSEAVIMSSRGIYGDRVSVPVSEMWKLMEAISESGKREMQEKMDELAGMYEREGS